MKIILTQDILKEYLYYKDGYLYRRVSIKHFNKNEVLGSLSKGSRYYACTFLGNRFLTHRLVFFYNYGYLPKLIDHIDGNALNNKIENLREASQTQNCRNAKKRKNTVSSYKGVCWNSANNNWRSIICVNKKLINLGSFKVELEAAKAYKEAAKFYFKEFYSNRI
jgi:hypothetical protein